MWNSDETAFATHAASKMSRGEKDVHETGGGSGQTILGCGSASGICLPPYVVY